MDTPEEEGGQRWTPPPDEVYRGYSGSTVARLSPRPESWVPLGGPSDPSSPPPKRRSHRAALLIAAGVIVCGGGGAAIGLSLGHSSTNPPAATGAGGTRPGTGGTRGSGGTVTTSPPGRPAGHALSTSAIASRVEPAVVDISTMVGGQLADEGTGMIITPAGEVLTNNHVVEGGTSFTAQINGAGRTYKALVLGVDPSHDVALLQLEGASGLPTVTLGNSTGLTVGEPVVAIGNALALPGPLTVTTGTISALGRSITANDQAAGTSENLTGLIQMDASINPGNSGGPLLNSEGQVIGMNTAAAAGSGAQPANNVGFAIPIDAAVSIVQKIQQGDASSAIVIGQRGLIGVEIESVSVAESSGLSSVFGQYVAPAPSGAVVVQLVPGSPAADTTLTIGDVIVSLGGRTVTSPADVSTVMAGKHPGQPISMTWVDSSHQRQRATIVLGTAPAQ